MEEHTTRDPTTRHYTRAIKQSMRRAMKTAYENHPDVVNTAQFCLESFIKTERVVAINRYPREHYAQEQHCLVAIDYSDRIVKKRFNFLDAREDLGNLAELYEEFAARDSKAAMTSLRLFRNLVQMTSELAALIEDQTKVQRTNWQAVLDSYPLPSAPVRSENNIAHCLPRLPQITEVKLLGAGGFGAIYHIYVGNINLSGKLVPIGKFKTMKQACSEKIVGSMVNSPLLVRYYACYQTCQAYVTMMEYIRGVDLQRIIGTLMSILTDEVNRVIIAQLGLALQYLHYRGFIHRDIKPSNVMVSPGCRIKLIDFDTCKICVGRFLSGNQNSFIRRTFVEFNDGESAGTLYFLPPEVLRKKPYGRAMDWWAVGVTSYQLLTGKLPFRGVNEKTLKERIKRGHVKYSSGNQLHQEFTKKLLVKFPTKRLTSARFEEFKNHAWFTPIDWQTIIHQRVCGDIEPLNQMFDIRNGVYSPKTEAVAQKHKGKLLLTFSQLYDLPPQEQDPLCLVVSEGFRKSLRKMHNGEPASETDIMEPYEYADTNVKFSKYKFIDYLAGKEKDLLKDVSLCGAALEQEGITEQPCSSEDDGSLRVTVEFGNQVSVTIVAPSEEDEIAEAFTHAALLANTKPPMLQMNASLVGASAGCMESNAGLRELRRDPADDAHYPSLVMHPTVMSDAGPWVMFESITYLGNWQWPLGDTRSFRNIISETMLKAMDVAKEDQIQVALKLPARADGKAVLLSKTTGEEIYSLPIRQISAFTVGLREHPGCFAFIYYPVLNDKNQRKVFCFNAISADVVQEVQKRIFQAMHSIQASNEAQFINTTEGAQQIVNVQMTLDIREEDSRGQFVPCARTTEVFKLRRNVEKLIVLTIDPTTQPSPVIIERCFGVLISPGRHVRHSDMQLIGTGNNDTSQPSSPSTAFYVDASWDPKDNPSFELLNTITSGESRVYLTVACDLVLMRVKEPVRFVFETQARIGPSQEKNRALWTLSTALGTSSSKPFSETFTLTLKQSHDCFELVEMTTSTGKVLHPIEQTQESGESDEDEPLLSGTGLVCKESGQEKLDEWSNLISVWEGNPKPKEVDVLIQNHGVPQVLRGQVWQLLTTSTSNNENYQLYQMLVKKENLPSVDQAIERDIHRTFPGHEFFKEAQGQEKLYRLCKAYSLHDTAVSYCQGLSYLAAALLLHMPEEQAFFILNVIMSHEKYNTRQLYLDNFETLHVKLYQLMKLYTEKIPEIGNHFRDLGIEAHMFASQWFLTLYTAKFPLYLVFLVLDNFMLTGPDFLFKFAVAILMESKRDLLTLDFEGVLKHFRVSIPRKYRSEESALKLIRSANHVKISAAKLKKWEKDFLQEKEANIDPNEKLQKDYRLLLNSQQRLDQENDDLAQELIATRFELTRQLDEANDKIDNLRKDVAQLQQYNTDLSQENEALRTQQEQLKEMCRREAENAEIVRCENNAKIRQQTDTISEYKKICGRLQEVNQAIQADCNRNKRKQLGEDTQEEETELQQQLRELELELAQTKLALVESECLCQELNHQLTRIVQDKEKSKESTPWLSKTIQGIIKKQNSQNSADA